MWPQYPNSKKLWSSGYLVESITSSSCKRDNLSKFKFRNEHNGDNTNWGRYFLALNKTSSASKRLPHCLTINSLNLAFLFRPKLFLYLGVVSSLEEDKEVSLLSFYFWNDLVLLFPIKFRISAYGYWFFSAFMNESGQIKTLKIITRTVGSGMPITYIFFNKKLYWRTASILKICTNFVFNYVILK